MPDAAESDVLLANARDVSARARLARAVLVVNAALHCLTIVLVVAGALHAPFAPAAAVGFLLAAASLLVSAITFLLFAGLAELSVSPFASCASRSPSRPAARSCRSWFPSRA